jgi:hypothetical protein
VLLREPRTAVGHLWLGDTQQLARGKRDRVPVVAGPAQDAVVVEQADVHDLGRGQERAEGRQRAHLEVSEVASELVFGGKLEM